jgi:hypothetical protein
VLSAHNTRQVPSSSSIEVWALRMRGFRAPLAASLAGFSAVRLAWRSDRAYDRRADESRDQEQPVHSGLAESLVAVKSRPLG